MKFAIIAFHVSLHLAVQQAKIASKSGISSLVRNDVLPNAPRWKTIVSSSKVQCASYCLSTAECKSFYFGHDECGLLKLQYSANDKVLHKKVGFAYYHFNEKYYETSPETTTPQETTTTGPPFVYHAEEVTFDEAYKRCKDKTRRLVCIHDETTWQTILQFIKDNGNPPKVWIGLNGTVHTAVTSYDLEWIDGVKLNKNTKFQRWASMFPREKVSCGEIMTGEWKDLPCSSLRPYICELPN